MIRLPLAGSRSYPRRRCRRHLYPQNDRRWRDPAGAGKESGLIGTD